MHEGVRARRSLQASRAVHKQRTGVPKQGNQHLKMWPQCLYPARRPPNHHGQGGASVSPLALTQASGPSVTSSGVLPSTIRSSRMRVLPAFGPFVHLSSPLSLYSLTQIHKDAVIQNTIEVVAQSIKLPSLDDVADLNPPVLAGARCHVCADSTQYGRRVLKPVEFLEFLQGAAL